MKKSILLSIACISLLTPAMAQKKGLLNKLNDKLEAAVAENSSANMNVNEKDIKKDLESTVLEKQTINNDSRKISGIYYSVKPLRVGDKFGNKFYSAQKFLVNYTEGDLNEITVATRYYYENKTDLVPLVFAPKPGTPDYFPITNSKKLGYLYVDGLKNNIEGDRKYAQEVNVLSFPSSGDNVTATKENKLPGYDILQLEDGILVIADFENITKAKTPAMYKFVQENGSYTLLYKKEKESVATAMTSAQVWDKIKKFYDPYMKAYNEADEARMDLEKPIGTFKDEPKNADLVAACKERMKQMKYYGPNEELVYCYPVTKWENRFESVGIQGRTLTHRVLQVQAVLRNGDKCFKTQFLIRQDNTYQAGSNAEKFTGNQVFCIGDIQKEDINCTKAMKYKK